MRYMTDEQIAKLYAMADAGKTKHEIAHELGFSTRTIYNHLADREQTITNAGFGKAARRMIAAEERRVDREMSELKVEERKHEQFTQRMLDMGYRLDGTKVSKPKTVKAGETVTASETIQAEDVAELIKGVAPGEELEIETVTEIEIEEPTAVCAGLTPRWDSAEERRHSEFTMNVMVFGQGVALSAKKAREMGEKLTRIADTMDELQRLTAGLEA